MEDKEKHEMENPGHSRSKDANSRRSKFNFAVGKRERKLRFYAVICTRYGLLAKC